MKNYPLNPTQRVRDLKELTDRSVRLYAQKEAFLSLTGKTEYTSTTYARFGEELCALANALIKRGLAGRRMALVGENSYPWLLSYFAIVNTNSTVVPMDKDLTQDELRMLVKRAEASVLFFSSTYAEEARHIKSGVPGLVTVSLGEKGEADVSLEELLEEGFALVANGEDRYSGIEIDRESTCSILFTSGTTGVSKGVMLSHRNLAANTVSACELVLFKPEDVLLSLLPINHAYEDMCGIFGPMHYGCTIAFCPGVKHTADCLKLFRPTVMALVPLYVETFNKRIWENAVKKGKERKLKLGIRLGNIAAALGIDIRDKLLHEVREAFGGRLKIVICGGAYLNPDLVKAFREFGVTILNGYGTTECSPIISANRNLSHKDKSVGWVASCCEVRFDENGQILVRGDSVMKGYLDDEEGTAEVFDGEWYMTGDLGFLDKQGFLYITGRSKDMIVLKNGKNIMPEEIEYLLQKSPLIAEVLVKEAPGDANGSDKLMAIIYPDPAKKAELGSRLHQAMQDEIDNVNQKLASFKQIHLFALRDTEFPKTTTRKIKRYQVIFGKG
jgi:long-chain acyl-CoA synthetase